MSDSIQAIDQLFHSHHTCTCYQTLHYYLRKYPTPLCKSIHSIDQLQYDSIDFTLSFQKNLPLLSDSIQSIDHMFHLKNICPYNQTLHYHFRKLLASLCESINSSVICNLILLILKYVLEKSVLFDLYHTIYWSAF